MMNTKQLATLSLAVLITAASAGCGNADKSSASSASSGTEAQSATGTPASSAVADPGYNTQGYPIFDEVKTYTVLNPSSSGEEWANLHLFKVMEELTGIRLEFSNTPAGDYDTRLNLLLASGDIPDVLWNALNGSNLQTYGVDGGMLYDIGGTMKEAMPNMVSMLEEYPMALAAVTEMNGSIYLLPKVSMTATESGETLFVRTDLLQKVGAGIPQTVEELRETMLKLKSAGFSSKFAPFLPSAMDTAEVYLFPSFGDGVDPGFADAGDGKTVVYNKISEQYQRYLQYMSGLYKQGLLEPEIYSMDKSVITAKIKANDCAFMTTGTSLSLTNFESGKYEVVLVPPMTSQYTSEKKVRGVPFEKVGGISISAKCKLPEALLRYLDIWYAEEDVIPGLNGISTKFGIYGEDWEYLDEQKKTYRRIVPESTSLTEEEWRISNVAPAAQPPALAIMNAVASGNPAQEMKGFECVNNLIPHWRDRFPVNFLKFTTEENEVIANKQTDIETYVATATAKFITGAEPMEQWDSFVSTVRSMGIEDVLKVYQASYDRLNAIKGSLTK